MPHVSGRKGFRTGDATDACEPVGAPATPDVDPKWEWHDRIEAWSEIKDDPLAALKGHALLNALEEADALFRAQPEGASAPPWEACLASVFSKNQGLCALLALHRSSGFHWFQPTGAGGAIQELLDAHKDVASQATQGLRAFPNPSAGRGAGFFLRRAATPPAVSHPGEACSPETVQALQNDPCRTPSSL